MLIWLVVESRMYQLQMSTCNLSAQTWHACDIIKHKYYANAIYAHKLPSHLFRKEGKNKKSFWGTYIYIYIYIDSLVTNVNEATSLFPWEVTLLLLLYSSVYTQPVQIFIFTKLSFNVISSSSIFNSFICDSISMDKTISICFIIIVID